MLKISRIEKWKLALVSTIATLLVIISVLPFYTPNKVFAYMSIDINPSIELSINNKLEVLSVTALNTEGERIIENLPDWKKQDIAFVTNSIIDESKKYGYLNEGSNLLITTVKIHQESTTKDIEKKLEEKIVIISETLVKDTIHVTSVKSDENTRKKAEEQGISTGKYLIEEAENRDKEHKEGEDAKTSSNHLKNESIIKLENQRDDLEKKEAKDKKDKRDHENKKDKKDKRDHENKKDKKDKRDHENKKDKKDKRDHENKKDKKDKRDHENKKDKKDKRDHENKKDKKDKRDHENKKDKKDKRDHENIKNKKDKRDHENKKDKKDKRDHENIKNKKDKRDHENKKDKKDKRDHENIKDKKDKRDHENIKDKKDKRDHENKKDKKDKKDHENIKVKSDHDNKKNKDDHKELEEHIFYY
ncbi:hypothetical protein [Cytobacillus sp. IB215316]|uniref:anti-sigma-I factor RsgI family protein n=1 Tax=Cytobacillus sp. IB215316 TaxID=3097354 RepID=UPI002A174C42|nr:hypothetical protein [Cytobacillus sp. IB215316]MDX8360481.1 hypothetical protein [Cytobacillus sp. IB215316]